MTLEIDLDNVTMEELEYFKSIIELKIGELELAQERLKDREIIRAYRDCFIVNTSVLRSCNPRIHNERGGLKSTIQDFVKSSDKKVWLKEHFINAVTCLIYEIHIQYKPRPTNILLDRKETVLLLEEFVRELDKIDVE